MLTEIMSLENTRLIYPSWRATHSFDVVLLVVTYFTALAIKQTSNLIYLSIEVVSTQDDKHMECWLNLIQNFQLTYHSHSDNICFKIIGYVKYRPCVVVLPSKYTRYQRRARSLKHHFHPSCKLRQLSKVDDVKRKMESATTTLPPYHQAYAKLTETWPPKVTDRMLLIAWKGDSMHKDHVRCAITWKYRRRDEPLLQAYTSNEAQALYLHQVGYETDYISVHRLGTFFEYKYATDETFMLTYFKSKFPDFLNHLSQPRRVPIDVFILPELIHVNRPFTKEFLDQLDANLPADTRLITELSSSEVALLHWNSAPLITKPVTSREGTSEQVYPVIPKLASSEAEASSSRITEIISLADLAIMESKSDVVKK